MDKKKEDRVTLLGHIHVDGKNFRQSINLDDDSVTISDADGTPILFFDSSANVFWCLSNGTKRLMGKIRTDNFFVWDFIFEDHDNILNYVPDCKVEMVTRFFVHCADYTDFERYLFEFLYPNLEK